MGTGTTLILLGKQQEEETLKLTNCTSRSSSLAFFSSRTEHTLQFAQLYHEEKEQDRVQFVLDKWTVDLIISYHRSVESVQ